MNVNQLSFLNFHSYLNILGGAGGNARFSRCIRETRSLKARFASFAFKQAVLAQIATLVEPIQVLISPPNLQTKIPPQGWYFMFGGAGGNRTRVRKPSTDSSTYLALLFNLTCNTPTDKQFARELP